MKLMTLLFLLAASQSSNAKLSPEQIEFFNHLSKLCGKSFEGKVVIDNKPSEAFTNKKMIMHVRECSNNQIKIPFHVGDDASRTWVISKTEQGLELKHDHRHKDGSPDSLTLYGGVATESGWSQVQSFPADDFTKNLFVKQGIPQSIRNTWQMYLYPTSFSYRLIREGREFQVDFNLDHVVDNPKAPWGYK